MNTSTTEADKYGNQTIQIAELSRDRKAIVQALLGNAVRLGNLAGYKNYTQRSTEFLEQAKKVAKENKLVEYEVKTLLRQVDLMLRIFEKDKAATFLDQAATLSVSLKDVYNN